MARLPRAPARRAGRAAPTSPRSPSGRSPTRRSAPPTSSARSTPTCSDPTSPSRSAIFHQRFSTNTTPSWERAQPFRFLCHNGEINAIQGNVNWMRAREGNFGSGRRRALPPRARRDGLGLGDARQRARASRARRPRRPARARDARPAGLGGRPRARPPRSGTSTATTRGSSSPGTGRRGSSSPTATSSAPRSTATGCGRSAYAVCEDGFVVCSSEAGAVPLDGHGRVQARQARPRPDDRRRPRAGASRTTTRSSAASPAERPYGDWLEEGIVRGRDRRTRSSRPTRTYAAAGAARLHARGAHADPPPDRLARARADLLDGRRHRAHAARRPCPAALPLLQAALRPGHEPADRPPARAVRDVAADGARQPRAAPLGGPGGRRRDRARELLPLPRRARAAPGRPAGRDVRAGRGARGGLRAARATRPRRRSAPAPGCCSSPTRTPRPSADPGAARDRDRAPPPRRQPACGRRPRSSSRRDEPARCTTSPACSATAPRRSARGSRSRRSPPWPPPTRSAATGRRPAEAQLRFKQAIEDGVLKVMSKMGISDVASYCGAQIFDAIGLAREVVDRASSARRARSAASASPSSSARSASALEAATAAKPALENPGYVKWRKGGEPHETNRRRRRRARTSWPPPTRCRRRSQRQRLRSGRLGALRAVRRARQRAAADGAARPARARPGRTAGPARRGRAGRGDRARASPAGAMSHGALSAEAHETIAIALNRLGGKANSGEGGEDPARFRDERNSPDQAGRVGPLRRHARVRGLRGRAPDQDRPGLEARRGRPAPRPQGLGARSRACATRQPGVALISPPPHHDIYSIEDLAQLIFDLQAGEPGGGGLGEARRPRAASASSRPASSRRSRTSSTSPGADGGTGREPAHVDQERRRRLGARSRRDAAGARRERAARACPRARRRRLQDRPRRRRRRTPRRRRDVASARRSCSPRAASWCAPATWTRVPVGIATQNPELRAKFAGDARAGHGVPRVRRRGGAAPARLARAPEPRGGRRPGRAAPPRRDRRRRAPTRSTSRRSLGTAGDGPDALRRRCPHRAEGLGARRPARGGGRADPGRVAPRRARSTRSATRTAPSALASGARSALASAPLRRPAACARRSTGVAGQGFGAFLAAGVELRLVGEANDYVGKGMGGGRIVISPPGNDAGEPRPHGQHGALRRHRRRALLRRGGRRALLRAQLRRGRRRRGRRRPPLRVHDERHGRHPRPVRPQPRRRHDRRRGVRLRPRGAHGAPPQRPARPRPAPRLGRGGATQSAALAPRAA